MSPCCEHKEQLCRLRLVALIALFATVVWAQEIPSRLRPHLRVEGHFQRKHETYSFEMRKGQYARVAVASSGLEVDVAIFAPDKPSGSEFWVAPSDTRNVSLISVAEYQYSIRIS